MQLLLVFYGLSVIFPVGYFAYSVSSNINKLLLWLWCKVSQLQERSLQYYHLWKSKQKPCTIASVCGCIFTLLATYLWTKVINQCIVLYYLVAISCYFVIGLQQKSWGAIDYQQLLYNVHLNIKSLSWKPES